MPQTKTKSKKNIKSTPKKNSILEKLNRLPLVGKLGLVVLTIAVIGLTGSYVYGRVKVNDYKTFAGSAIPDKWATLARKNGNTYYICQQLINNKWYARGIVVRDNTDVAPLAIAVQTYHDALQSPAAFGGNSVTGGYAYYGTISAPAAELPKSGWAKVIIAGEEFTVARGFTPPCDTNTDQALTAERRNSSR